MLFGYNLFVVCKYFGDRLFVEGNIYKFGGIFVENIIVFGIKMILDCKFM